MPRTSLEIFYDYFRKEKKITDRRKLSDYVREADELNCMTVDTILFLFEDTGNLTINDGYILEV